MTENAGKVLAQNEAPYTDPGLHGQEQISNEAQSTVAPDQVAPGTPVTGTHPGTNEGNGERAASLYDHEAARKSELESRSTRTVGE